MKRLAAAALILSMVFTAFTGCVGNKEEENDDAAVQAAILYEFNHISQIPRESGHEKEISAYLRSWAKDNGLDSARDSLNNIIIDLPASPGYEDAPLTIIQSNMDTRIAVSADSQFDPQSDPLTVTDDGISLHAEGTSIGAGSGAGMAAALYILKHARAHGPVRAIFTSDGEAGMTGAEKLNEKYLDGDYLINLSWDSGGGVGLGSGGTAAFDMTHKIQWVDPQNAIPYTLSLSGLNGGDDGKEAGSHGTNAIKAIGDILANAQGKGILFELGSFNGGSSRDTIAQSASALIVINESDVKKMQNQIDDSIKAFDDAYGGVEENYTFTYQEAQMPEKVVSFEDTGSIISFLYGILNGVQSMSEEYEGVVDSFSNLGMVSTATGDFICQISAGATSDVELYKITSAHETISGMSGMEYTYYDGVPRWPDHPDSVLYAAVSDIWSELYGDKPKGAIVHYPLEFGWFAKKNPRLQIISIGPDIENAGLPGEALVLETVTRPANVVLTFLERINEVGKM
jgi:dipeptidase D